jgi:ketosteroid isomerase-like protein
LCLVGVAVIVYAPVEVRSKIARDVEVDVTVYASRVTGRSRITPTGVSDNKALVRRLVDQVINGVDLDALDELCTPSLAPKLRLAFTQFRDAFPDWHQHVVKLVAEEDTVVARFVCTGTHGRTWQGLAPSGRQMRVDEVYFFTIRDHRISRVWGLEDTWSRMRQLAGDNVTLGELGSLS